jgi:GT2 family glycosyltransferase
VPIFLIVSSTIAFGGLPLHKLQIIIPSWNGRQILAQCLPAVLACTRELLPPAASTDGTCEYLAENFPEIDVVTLPRRGGFPGAVNAGAFASSADVLLFLNNDMIPQGPVLPPLIADFFDPSVAAVGARVVKWDRTTIDVGRKLRTLDRGEIVGAGDNEDYPEVSYTFFASGGAMAVDRRRFVQLGGFDELYSPGYVEDTDLCYRMWKRGWKILWDPRSTFAHMGSATFAPNRNGPRRYVDLCKVRYILRRNAFYFYWKNLTDRQARRDHWKHFAERSLSALLAGDVFYFAGLARALTRLRGLNRRRQDELRHVFIGDAELFATLAELCSSKHAPEKPAELACAPTGGAQALDPRSRS